MEPVQLRFGAPPVAAASITLFYDGETHYWRGRCVRRFVGHEWSYAADAFTLDECTLDELLDGVEGWCYTYLRQTR